MSEYILVDCNFSYEGLPLGGFRVCTKDEWDAFVAKVKAVNKKFWSSDMLVFLDDEGDHSFIVGEDIEYVSKYLSLFDVTPITDETAHSLAALFDPEVECGGQFDYGSFLDISEAIAAYDEDPESYNTK